jgi:predicted Zn-dependent protease
MPSTASSGGRHAGAIGRIEMKKLFWLCPLVLLACTQLPPDEGPQPFGPSDLEVEREIALAGMQQIGADLTPLPDPVVQDYVRRVGAKLAAVCDRTDLAWTFQVIASDEMNAFTIGDGKVFLYAGLLTRLENEAQMAAVLAHEIGHVARFHTVISYQKATETQTLMGLAGAVLGGGELAALAGNVAGSILQSGFSRDQEDQADRLALVYMQQAGYDVSQFPRVFEIFMEQAGDQPEFYNDLFGDHPTNAARIAESKRIIAEKYAAQRNPVVGEAEYRSVISRIQ